MALIKCPECDKRISDKAAACPGCGNPINGGGDVTFSRGSRRKRKIDKKGAWCPNCGNRNSTKESQGGSCLLIGILFISIIGILLIPFLPKVWKCKECKHTWRA